MRPCKRIDAALQVTVKANRLDDMIRGRLPDIRPLDRPPMQDFLLGVGETGLCYPDINREVIHMSCTTLAADPQRTPHRPVRVPAERVPVARRLRNARHGIDGLA